MGEDARGTWPTELTKQGSYRLIETEAASIGLQGSDPE